MAAVVVVPTVVVVDGTSRAEGVGRKMGELACWADAAFKSPSESVLAVVNAGGFLQKSGNS